MSRDNHSDLKVNLLVGGVWRPGASGNEMPVTDPSNGSVIGSVAVAETADLEMAVGTLDRGWKAWRQISAFARSSTMRHAADLLRGRSDSIAEILTLEQGKPLADARMEVMLCADIIDWCADEARRLYGSTIPSRDRSVIQMTMTESIGPVAAFAPWNFPLNQSVRKVAGALAAGCAIILKGPEDTPASTAAMMQTFLDAGVEPEAMSLVYGRPAEISSFLIAHPLIRKVTFTGSTAVGRMIAELAGRHLKPATLELGGHAPVLIFDDADAKAAAAALAKQKFRNAGQVCVSPTRFLVQDAVADEFIEQFIAQANTIRVGPGMHADTTMGPLINERRVKAVEDLIADALSAKATLLTGGHRVGNIGSFLAPTVLADVPRSARIMNEEPFGPVALINRFRDYEEAISEANRLPYGLAAYVYSRSDVTISRAVGDIESGMVSVNHGGLGLPETPFGGIRDSGFGTEGGPVALEAFVTHKFITHAFG